MIDLLAGAVPPVYSLPFVAALLVATAGLSSVLTLRFATRSRRAVVPAAAGHALEDQGLLWRALEAHAMVNVADSEGRTISVNDAFTDKTGYTRDEILGTRLRDYLFVPGTIGRDAVMQAIRDQGGWTGETHLVRKDGSHIWTRTTVVGVVGETGEIARTVALRTDITRNKVLQDAAQKKLLLDGLRDEVYVFDAGDLSLRYLNRRALAVLGWSVEDCAQSTLADTNVDFDEAGFHARVAPLRTGELDVLTYESIHQGRPVEISLQLDRAFDGSEQFIGVIRDLTARKKAEAAKAALVATVSHELRAPLTSVLGALKLMASGALGELGERPVSVLGIAVRNVERLVVTINDLLDLEKFGAGKMDMPLAPTDLSVVLKDAVASNAAYAGALGVRLRCIGADRPHVVEANQDRIIQVLNNLLSNAAKFSRRGETVEVELRDTEQSVQIIVTDRGAGIPEELQGRLFERFVQAGTPQHGRPTGSGLGLSIAKAIVERHGGTIGFTSKPGQGSTFRVEFPRAARVEQAA